MADPLGFISGVQGVGGIGRVDRAAGAPFPASGAAGRAQDSSFKDVLRAGVDEVNRAQQEATSAVEGLMGGERVDVESVVLATQKADNAFRMLQALRNRMVEAYDEIKQMRV